MLTEFYRHEKGYVITPYLSVLALASWLAARDAWALALLLFPLAAGLAVGGEKIVTARNIAREPGILPGVKKEVRYTKSVVQEATGPDTYENRHGEKVACYHTRKDGPIVYVPLHPVGPLAKLPHVPKDLVKAFQEVPAEAQPLLATICTLFLEQVDEITKKYHEKNPGMVHGAIKTSLRELAERMGLSPSGKNFRTIAQMLGLMAFTHTKDFVIGYKSKKGQTEEITMSIGRFITWIEYRWKKDRPFSDTTVGITICPALTDLLLSPECQRQLVWVPVDVIKKLRRKARRSKYSIPVLFYVMAARPGGGRPFKISWKKLAEKVLPERTKSGRPVRPAEKRKLISEILKDIGSTGIVEVEESTEGIYTIYYGPKPSEASAIDASPVEKEKPCNGSFSKSKVSTNNDITENQQRHS